MTVRMQPLHPSRRRRALAVVAGTLTGSVSLLLAADPAAALVGDAGSPQPMSTASTILVFGVAPLLVFLIVAALTLRPRRSQPMRPASGSTPSAATWVGPHGGEAEPAASGAARHSGGGGASGSW